MNRDTNKLNKSVMWERKMRTFIKGQKNEII